MFYACTQIARFMWPTWDPPGADRTQVGPVLVPWTLLSGYWCLESIKEIGNAPKISHKFNLRILTFRYYQNYRNVDVLLWTEFSVSLCFCVCECVKRESTLHVYESTLHIYTIQITHLYTNTGTCPIAKYIKYLLEFLVLNRKCMFVDPILNLECACFFPELYIFV